MNHTRHNFIKNLQTTVALLVLFFASCNYSRASEVVLIDPAAEIKSYWRAQNFVRETLFEPIVKDGIPAIRARGDQSASGLIRKLKLDPNDTPRIRWQWRVDELQASADIRDIDREDYGAVIFFLFGKPGLLYRNIRSLGYVWTNDSIPRDSVIKAARRPDRSRYLVLQSGTENLGQWVEEERDLLQDFRRAYGVAPPPLLSGVSIFVDNDQTEEPVLSFFGALHAFP